MIVGVEICFKGTHAFYSVDSLCQNLLLEIMKDQKPVLPLNSLAKWR